MIFTLRYVLDANVFISAREHYFPETFPSFWKNLAKAGQKGIITSDKEVWDEIHHHPYETDHLKKWMRENRGIFGNPSLVEQKRAGEIVKEYPTAERKSNGPPWADPILIARAQVNNAAVVTEETSKRDTHGNLRNPHKIPDICSDLGVRCITPQEFMKELKWRF